MNNGMQQGEPYHQGQQQSQGQQQNRHNQPNQNNQQSKHPIDRGLVQVPVGVYASKKNFEPDGMTPKQETEFLPIGKFTEWEKHITVDICINGEKLSLMLFKTPPQDNQQPQNY